jgi:hypothetical protein
MRAYEMRMRPVRQKLGIVNTGGIIEFRPPADARPQVEINSALSNSMPLRLLR